MLGKASRVRADTRQETSTPHLLQR
ncbi:hypothetical protein F01_230202 [Burkholderia cenocepacia]|nr:hypothetical protein F01_230202 [Burkholderia cenocepacia]